MYTLYKALTNLSAPALSYILNRRLKIGKEHGLRLNERKGLPSCPRPDGILIWVHAASVGEAQSALIIIDTLSKHSENIKVIVTTGTVTSAALMDKRLPQNAFHQFYPLDHPKWVDNFLNHWRPDAVLWMESELWPNMLHEIKKRNIPALLINARLSAKSFSTWRKFGNGSKIMLSTFHKILCQSEQDQSYFEKLGAEHAIVSGNIKHSAAPLTFDELALNALKEAVKNRPLWLYASTHDGEEELALNIHKKLKKSLPDILTIIVPRHPERRDAIKTICEEAALKATLRGQQAILPSLNDDLYIADTLGELGLFYRIAPITCIGRSFSRDGGGGHNPIEAAQLNCVVLHGPNVQNLQDIYSDMDAFGASKQVNTKAELHDTLLQYLSDTEGMKLQQEKALQYSAKNNDILDNVMNEIISTFDANKVIKLCP